MSSLQAYLNAGLKVLLVGPPGIGKTARILDAAKAAGHKAVIVRASLAERVDIGGALVPDIAAGVTRELPLATIHALQQSEAPTLLFLDDLGQAPIDVQAACMKLFDSGFLPPHVTIWGATNRPADKAGVSALCEPLRSRFDLAFAVATPDLAGDAAARALGSWTEEVEGWCAWALSVGAPPTVVAWHRQSHGRTLYAWRPSADPAERMADFRSWASVIKLERAGLADLSSVSACIGPSAAVEYFAFRELVGSLPPLSAVVADPHGASVPTDASQLWLLSTALGSYMTPDNAASVLTYCDRLPRAYCALAARDAYRRAGAALARSPAWSAWFVQNQALFS